MSKNICEGLFNCKIVVHLFRLVGLIVGLTVNLVR